MGNDFESVAGTIGKIPEGETEDKYLTFFTDGQLFGISIADVVQIVGIRPITEIPEFPHYAKGIINLRGEMIPVIDMRLRLGKAEAEYNERTCVIVTGTNEHHIGLIVDRVDEVADISSGQIAPPPTVAGAAQSYLMGVGKLTDQVVLLMNTEKLLGNQELACLDRTNME